MEPSTQALLADAFQRSEEKLKLGLQVAGFAIVEVDYLTGNFSFSKEAAALYGLGDEALIVSLDDLGLVAALEWQTRAWEHETNITFELVLPVEDIAVHPERSTAIFRVFQESLTNIARHAEATQVDVTLEADGGHLLLTIHDNGQGIDPEVLRPGKSLGLLGMRERIREVSGELDIVGGPGAGTTVIRVPLE